MSLRDQRSHIELHQNNDKDCTMVGFEITDIYHKTKSVGPINLIGEEFPKYYQFLNRARSIQYTHCR